MKEIKFIRVESDKEVTHYSTKYYVVKFNEVIHADELLLKGMNKSIAQVKPISLNNTVINYKEICRH